MNATSARLPAVVVAGRRGAGKTTLIRNWLDESAPDRITAVLVDDLAMSGYGTSPSNAIVKVVGGCACCSAREAMRLAVMRLLREGRVGRLIYELGAHGHLPGVIDRLREAPFDRWLQLVAVVTVIDGSRFEPSGDAGDPVETIPDDRIGAADVLVVHHLDPDPGRRRATIERMHRLAPFEPAVLDATTALPGWDEMIAAAGPAMPGSAVFGPSAAGRRSDLDRIDGSGGLAVRWTWPASVVFDRALLQRDLPTVLANPPLTWARVALRTEREWYALPASADHRWQPTPWRHDNRVEVGFADHDTRQRLAPPIEAALLAALPETPVTGPPIAVPKK